MTLSSRNGVSQAIPFFGVTDMEASLSFYLDGLGFKLQNKWTPEGKIRWCMLTIDKAAVMLQEYLPDWRPTDPLGTGVSICFICDDAIAIYKSIIANGIPAQRPFVGNSMWVTSVTDPDGYKMFFESPTDAAEESEYTDQ